MRGVGGAATTVREGVRRRTGKGRAGEAEGRGPPARWVARGVAVRVGGLAGLDEKMLSYHQVAREEDEWMSQ